MKKRIIAAPGLKDKMAKAAVTALEANGIYHLIESFTKRSVPQAAAQENGRAAYGDVYAFPVGSDGLTLFACEDDFFVRLTDVERGDQPSGSTAGLREGAGTGSETPWNSGAHRSRGIAAFARNLLQPRFFSKAPREHHHAPRS